MELIEQTFSVASWIPVLFMLAMALMIAFCLVLFGLIHKAIEYLFG